MKANSFISNDNAQMGTGNIAINAVLVLVVVGVMLYVGLQIMQGIDDSNTITSTTVNNSTTYDTFYNASQDVTTGVETSFSLSGTMMLVIIAGAIISLLLVFVVLR